MDQDCKPKILIIDDDDDYAASTQALLESHGYHVVRADSGRQGLKMLPDVKPDAIVLDIIMESDTEGYGVNAAIKQYDKYKDFRTIPILMASSVDVSPGERFPRLSREVGQIQPDFYFTKPLDVARFITTLEEALEK